MSHSQGLYISLDDAQKKTGTAQFFTRDKNGNFVESGTVGGGVATFSSARANARIERENERLQRQEELAKRLQAEREKAQQARELKNKQEIERANKNIIKIQNQRRQIINKKSSVVESVKKTEKVKKVSEQPTQTEQRLQQSLPGFLRDSTVSDVINQRSTGRNTFEKRQVGEFRGTPVTEFFIKDTNIKATPEERDVLINQTSKDLVIGSGRRTLKEKVSSTISDIGNSKIIKNIKKTGQETQITPTVIQGINQATRLVTLPVKGALNIVKTTSQQAEKGIKNLPSFPGRSGDLKTVQFIEGASSGAERFIGEHPTKTVLIAGAGAGVGLVARGVGALATAQGSTASAIFSGIETGIGAGAIGASVLNTVIEVKNTPTVRQKGEVIGEKVVEFGAFSVGALAGSQASEVLIGKVRTRNLRELKNIKPGQESFKRGENDIFFDRDISGRFKEQRFNIIDPKSEFAGGTQRFPQINRGDMAGTLKVEFSEGIIPGEFGKIKIERGFSARNQKLGKTVPESKGKKGELIGFFSSGKLNPSFLRLQAGSSSNVKLINFGPSTGLPLVVRSTFESGIEFAPGVGPKSRVAPLKFDTKEFSQQTSGSGRTFLGFNKAEKEVVTAVDSPIINAQRKFSIKINGVHVPIETRDIPKSGKVGKNTITKKEADFALESSTAPPSSLINQRSSLAPTRSRGKSSSVSNVSSIIHTPSRITPSSSNRPSSSGSSSGVSSSSGISSSSSAISKSSIVKSSITRAPSSSGSSILSSLSSILSSTKSGSSSFLSSSSKKSSGKSSIISKKNIKKKKKGKGVFDVLVRRRGKFEFVGSTSSITGATSLGKKIVNNSLSATFRVIGGTGKIKTPQGFRKPKDSSKIKLPRTFIEKRRFRINTGGEKKQIRISKKMKGGIIN